MKNINKDILEEYQSFASRCWHEDNNYLLEYNQNTLDDLLTSSKSVDVFDFSIDTKLIYGIDLDITFNADGKKSELWVPESVNRVPFIFRFLEAIISTNYNEYFYFCEEEGPETFLYVKRVKKDDVRFVHISQRVQFADYIQTEDFKIRQDIIINKNKFIKDFYISIKKATEKGAINKLKEDGFSYQINDFKILKEGSPSIEKYLDDFDYEK